MATHRIEIDTNQATNSVERLGDALTTTTQDLAKLNKQSEIAGSSFSDFSLDFQQKADNIEKSTKGITGGFQLAVGALALFGTENEGLNKVVQTMSSLMAVSTGLKDFAEGSEAFKKLSTSVKGSSKSLSGFKKALIGTGIGAIVVVLGAVISQWDEFTKAIGLSDEKLNKIKDTLNGVKQVATNVIKGIATSLGKLLKGDFKGALEVIKDGFNVRDSFQEGLKVREKKESEERLKLQQEENEKARELARQRTEALRQEKEKELRALEDKYRDFGKTQEQILTETYEKEIKLASNNAELKQKIEEKYQEDLKAIKEKAEQDELARIEKDKQERIKAEQEAAQKVKEAREASELSNSLSYEKELNELLNSDLSYSEFINKKKELDEEYNDLRINQIKSILETDELTDKERLALYQELNGLIRKEEEEQNSWLSENMAKRINTAQTFIDTYASATTGLLDSLAANMDEDSEAYRATQITKTIISTLSGVVSAISGAMELGPIAGPIVGAVNSAAVLASGIASINQIRSANENTSLSGGTFSNVVSNSSPGLSEINSLNNPVSSTTNIVPDSRNEGNKVYVVETDISNVQKKKKSIQSQVKF